MLIVCSELVSRRWYLVAALARFLPCARPVHAESGPAPASDHRSEPEIKLVAIALGPVLAGYEHWVRADDLRNIRSHLWKVAKDQTAKKEGQGTVQKEQRF
jgi:hypothetical protein